MAKSVLAVIAIFLCTTIAWMILGATILSRTFSADEGLGSRVASTWGGPQQQCPPSATTPRIVTKTVQETVNGVVVTKAVEETVADPLSLERSRIRAGLELQQRQKGLLWFATYRVAFQGDYLFRNTTASDAVSLALVFPLPEAIYDDLVFRVDGKPVVTAAVNGAVTATVKVPPGDVVSMFIITTMRRIHLHPMHYFFLATSFFAFHLLLAYLVDHISIHAAFLICSAVSVFLVVSYLRIVVGTRFAFVEAAVAQIVYLVGFSYAFFFKGFTGLAVTIGAIVSLFVVMQLTARIDWRNGGAREMAAETT